MKTRSMSARSKSRFLAALEMTVLSMAKVRGVVVFVAALRLLALQASAQVTAERLLNSFKEPQNWLMSSGGYGGHRFSAIDQINVSNTARLGAKWADTRMSTA